MKILIVMLMFVCICFSQTSTSTLTIQEAKDIAKNIIVLNPSWRIGNISKTNSMYPTLDYNTVVVLEPVLSETILNKNDIVLFDVGDRFNVLHRIIEVSPNGYLIKGDNVKNPDGYIQKENIYYRVVIILNTK